ncbi:MAG TPA: hypothetical protein VK772_02895 [Puia sp.]|jgi:hypothetical protein|nr:hypothetical protein [Puia sp.]
MSKKLLFFIFCFASAALCFYMLKESVLNRPKQNPVLIITLLRSGMPLSYRDSLRLKEIMMENLLKSQKNKR